MNKYLSYEFWDYDSLVYFDYDDLIKKKVDAFTACFLSEYGLPMFCAPHIHFDSFYSDDFDEKKIKIGEDENDSPISINLESNEVFVGNKFMNSSVVHLKQTLVYYAETIEDALKENRELFITENKIAKSNISRLENKIKRIEAKDKFLNSFWYVQIRKHNS